MEKPERRDLETVIERAARAGTQGRTAAIAVSDEGEETVVLPQGERVIAATAELSGDRSKGSHLVSLAANTRDGQQDR